MPFFVLLEVCGYCIVSNREFYIFLLISDEEKRIHRNGGKILWEEWN